MSTGTVKWYNERKGYGFITPEDGGEDLFVHHSEIPSEGRASLEEGQKVEYEVGGDEKNRPCAIKICPCEEKPQIPEEPQETPSEEPQENPSEEPQETPPKESEEAPA